uniref:Kelch-like protein diablo n=1 Tax=Oryzias melastigma TaxID=30732 RepID=A0A3B3BTP6_ORYME
MNTGKRDFEFCFRKNNFCITNGFLTASTCVFCSSVRASMEEPERCDLQTAVQSPANHATSTASPINARLSRRPASEAHGDMMFMVGGWMQSDPSFLVERFCPDVNEWRSTAHVFNNRAGVAVAALEGRIYTAGGENNAQRYSSVERYSPDSDCWSTDVAPLSSPRSGVCLVAMDGYLYAAGGHDGFTAVNIVERYDPHTNEWSKQPPMLTRRSRAAAAVLQGHLYVIGGNDGENALSSVERYDPLEGTWSVCSHMLSPRESAGCAAYMGHIYVAGGKDELNLKLCSAERFDPCEMRWSSVKCMRSKRESVSLAVFNGVLLAIGGHDGDSDLKSIDIYDHETNSWRYFGSLKSKHPGGRVAVLRLNTTLI